MRASGALPDVSTLTLCLGSCVELIYSNRGASDWRFQVARKWMTVQPNTVLRVNNQGLGLRVGNLRAALDRKSTRLNSSH